MSVCLKPGSLPAFFYECIYAFFESGICNNQKSKHFCGVKRVVIQILQDHYFIEFCE